MLDYPRVASEQMRNAQIFYGRPPTAANMSCTPLRVTYYGMPNLQMGRRLCKDKKVGGRVSLVGYIRCRRLECMLCEKLNTTTSNSCLGPSRYYPNVQYLLLKRMFVLPTRERRRREIAKMGVTIQEASFAIWRLRFLASTSEWSRSGAHFERNWVTMGYDS